MIVVPKVKGFICTTAHKEGCKHVVANQIAYAKKNLVADGPKRALIIGCSMGYGLASRITAAFGSNAKTIGIMYDKPSIRKRTATAGWYNTAAFEEIAHAEGLYAKSINGDAYSDAVKQKAIEMIKSDLGQVDFVVYSLASPVRVDPQTGEMYRSRLKPMECTYKNKSVNTSTGEVIDVAIEPADEKEVQDTIKVMGGEDWKLWIDALKQADVLSENAVTVAYSYIGPEVTHPIYKDGTIGMAKNHLYKTADELTADLKDINGKAYVSVNKALVTQASSAIPVVPLYISILYKVMKEKGLHEGCIEQIVRLFNERLYSKSDIETDENGLIRIDDWEMKEEVQNEIDRVWQKVNTDNLYELTDIEGYKTEFLNLFGFDIPGVDYEEDIDIVKQIDSIEPTD